MAVSPLATPGFVPGAETATPPISRPARPPRAVPIGTAMYTRRELVTARRLDTTYREMYTAALPELESRTQIVVGVTSAVRGEGRTTTALGLALAIARDLEGRVLLIELDLEQPTLTGELQLQEGPGLVDTLIDNVPIDDAMRHLDLYSVDILPAGRPAAAVSRLLRSAPLRELIAAARQSYRVVVLDLPPALVSSDVGPLSSLTDGVLMVVRAGVTPARLVEQATARFAEDKVRGVILTGQRSKIPNWLRRLF